MYWLRLISGVLATFVVVGLWADAGRVRGQNAPAPSPPAPAQTQPVFRGGVNYVLVDAYPQRNGQIVEGLKADDFQILEDGKPQTVDAFEFVRVDTRQPESAYRDPNTISEMNAAAADPHARVFVVFLDTAHTKVDGSNRIRVPLVKTLNSIIGPADLFGVITQNQEARDLTLQRHVTSVENQLSRYWTWGQSGRLTTDQQDPLEEMLTSCFRLRYPLPTPADPNPSPEPWVVADGTVMRTLDLLLIDRRREDRLLGKLGDLVAHLGSLREARTVLMMITDGWELFSPNRVLENEPPRDRRLGVSLMPAGVPVPQARRVTVVDENQEFTRCVGELNQLVELDNAKRFRDIIALAQRSNVSVYPVSSAGLQTFDTDVSQRLEPNPKNKIAGAERLQGIEQMADRIRNLQTIAENTGGIAIVQNNDLTAGMKRIVDDVSAYYLLGYYSNNPKADGRFRKIDVKMKPQGVTVHARRGYMAAGTVARGPAPVTPGMAAANATAAPVNAALAALSRARDSAELYVQGTAFGDALVVAVELGSRPMASGDWAKGGTVTVTAASNSGGGDLSGTAAIEPGGRGALVTIPLTQGAGPWKVTAKLASGLASLSDRVDVPIAPAGSVSGPVVYRATPSPRSLLTPVASFEFRRNERIHVEWRTIAELDGRTARVLDRNGQPLPLGAAVTERVVDDKRTVAVDVNLAPLAEGDYVIELTTQKGSESATSLVAFRVVR
ncbi:MAG: VWA domain-containing protein [Acidobacteriota bacterium]